MDFVPLTAAVSDSSVHAGRWLWGSVISGKALLHV